MNDYSRNSARGFFDQSSKAANAADGQSEDVRLTKREIEVLAQVTEGKSSREVAEALLVSKRTVDFHLANVFGKLGVNNRLQAFRRAVRLGLLPTDDSDSG